MKFNQPLKPLRAAGAAVIAAVLFAAPLQAAEKMPLTLDLPLKTLKGTPEDLPSGPNIEPLSDDPPPALEVPKGVVNVAAGKPVTSSVAPYLGDLQQITDGKKEPLDDDAVEFRRGTQWVQVDLGQAYEIHALAVWHDHRYFQVIYDIVLQVSDDPEFKTGVTTLYNTDSDNSSGQGVGTDREYFQSRFGRAILAKGVKARYVRGYSRGSNQTGLNAWQEIEVYALPAK